MHQARDIRQNLEMMFRKLSFQNHSLFKIIYLFIFRDGKGGREREGNINVWLPLTPGTWPTTQACALTGTQTGSLSVRRSALSPLSHTSQG